MTCNPEEWYKQADFDIAAAINMSKSTTYPYAVFFCQQAIEKALKGLYVKKFKRQPEKIHSLVAIAVKLDITIPNSISSTIQFLNAASVSIRYPPDIEELLEIYSKDRVYDIIKRSEEVLEWILRN